MPTYDYRCAACGHTLEIFQPISEAPKRKCPACGALRLQRVIGAGAGIIFKGSGFYQTDYRSDSYHKAAEAEKKAAEPPKDGAQSDSSAKGSAKGKDAGGKGSKDD